MSRNQMKILVVRAKEEMKAVGELSEVQEIGTSCSPLN